MRVANDLANGFFNVVIVTFAKGHRLDSHAAMRSWRPGDRRRWPFAVSAMCSTRFWPTKISIPARLVRPASNRHLLPVRNGRRDWHPLFQCNQTSWPIKAMIRSLVDFWGASPRQCVLANLDAIQVDNLGWACIAGHHAQVSLVVARRWLTTVICL